MTAAGGGKKEYAKERNKESFDGEAKKGDYISDRILIWKVKQTLKY